MATSEARKRATKKYIAEKTDDIRIRAPRGTKSEWQSAADAAGVSLTQYVRGAVSAQIERDKSE